MDWTISPVAHAEEVLRQFLYKVGNNLVVFQFSNRSHVKFNPSNVHERGWKKTKPTVLRIKKMSNNAWGVRQATKETLQIILLEKLQLYSELKEAVKWHQLLEQDSANSATRWAFGSVLPKYLTSVLLRFLTLSAFPFFFNFPIDSDAFKD